MSIEFAWRRIAGAEIAGLKAEDRAELAPHLLDPEHDRLRAAGLIVGTEHDGVVVGALLELGDGGSAGAQAFVDMPADWDDEYLVGVIGADAVRHIAAALSAAKWRTWLTEHFDALLAGAGQAGYENAVVGAAPDGPWADHVLLSAAELTQLFGAAAAAGESIVFSMSA